MNKRDRAKYAIKNHPPTVQGIIIGILLPLYLWCVETIPVAEFLSTGVEDGLRKASLLIPVIVNRIGERFTWSDERIKNEKLDAEYGSVEGPAEDLPIPNNDLVE